MAVDEERVQELIGQLAGHMTGAAICLTIWLGDELGYYRELAGTGALTADAVATRTGCNPRLTREWLDAQAAGGIVSFDASADTYAISDEMAAILADDDTPTFMARGMNALLSMFADGDKLRDAYRADGALGWADHHPCLFRGTEWFFRPGYRAFLTSAWIPALEGVETKLQSGARVADVGCGHGASVVVMAQTYPNSTIHGFDFHAPSIETSKSASRGGRRVGPHRVRGRGREGVRGEL